MDAVLAFRLPAHDPSHCGNRRRGLLGRRLVSESAAIPLVRESDVREVLIVQVTPNRRGARTPVGRARSSAA